VGESDKNLFGNFGPDSALGRDCFLWMEVLSPTQRDFTMSNYDFSQSQASCFEDERGITEEHALARMERVLQMIRLLQSGKAYTTHELSDQFRVAQRTIYRDIKLLRDCGVPIDSGPRGRGYRVDGGVFSREPPPTNADIAALVLGVHLARNMEAPSMERLLRGALDRLLGPAESELAERLKRFDRLFDIADMASIGELQDFKWTGRLIECLQQGTLVRVWIPDLLLVGSNDCLQLVPRQLKIADDAWWLIADDEDGREVQPLDLRSIEMFEGV
jgi:biotin operon repressor